MVILLYKIGLIKESLCFTHNLRSSPVKGYLFDRVQQIVHEPDE